MKTMLGINECFDPQYGFLSISNPPILRLNSDYEEWEEIVDDLHALIISQQLRERVQKLKILHDCNLYTSKDLERAHLVLCLIGHAYIIGFPKVDLPDPILPASIAVPWYEISQKLGLNPVVCYNSIELSNYKILDKSKDLSIDNIAMLHTFSGSFDEAWFYIIPLGIEIAGGSAVQSIIDIKNNFSLENTQITLERLGNIKLKLNEMTDMLKKMYLKNDPKIFWDRVRPYSGGSKNADLFPDGIFFEGVLNMDEFVNENALPIKGKAGTWRRYAGASAGQSPLIHCLDILLGISHSTIGNSSSNPMIEMRSYLSKSHSDFLLKLSSEPLLCDIIRKSGNIILMQEFNEILECMKVFRNEHMRLASVYIIQQSLKEKSDRTEESIKGTGGTDLVQFLKQTRDETVNARIELPEAHNYHSNKIGIGLSIGLTAAKQGAKVVICAKTTEPHPKLPGTIYTAAEEIIKAGGQALPVVCDIRFEDQVEAAIAKTVEVFGGIDIVINNASAISIGNTSETSLKKFDLMNQVNGRGTWLVSKHAIPHLKESARKGRNPHILVLCPPPDLRTMWFENHVAYTMAKYAMSLCVIGLAGELKEHNIAVNGLWPLTTIETSAVRNILDTEQKAKTRSPQIMADAAFVILSQDSKSYSGNFVIDETILRFQGVTCFDKYKSDQRCSDEEITMDFFLPENPYAAFPPPKQVLSRL